MEIFLTLRADPTSLSMAWQLLEIGQRLLEKGTLLMATLQEDLDAVRAQTTELKSLDVLIQALIARVNAVPGLTPEQQAAIDAIGQGIIGNAAVIAAMKANIPAA
jgi:hypothetical protein